LFPQVITLQFNDPQFQGEMLWAHEVIKKGTLFPLQKRHDADSLKQEFCKLWKLYETTYDRYTRSGAAILASAGAGPLVSGALLAGLHNSSSLVMHMRVMNTKVQRPIKRWHCGTKP